MDYRAFDKKISEKYGIPPEASMYIRACAYNKHFTREQMRDYLFERTNRQLQAIQGFNRQLKLTDKYTPETLEFIKRDLAATAKAMNFRLSLYAFLHTCGDLVFEEIARPH